jgi:hypothetical protein
MREAEEQQRPPAAQRRVVERLAVVAGQPERGQRLRLGQDVRVTMDFDERLGRRGFRRLAQQQPCAAGKHEERDAGAERDAREHANPS